MSLGKMKFNLDLCIYIKSMQEQTPLKLYDVT